MNSWSLTVVRPQRNCCPPDGRDTAGHCQVSTYGDLLRRLPVIVFVQHRDRGVHWPASLYLAEIGLSSASVTGDTVRSYAEAVLCWFRYLEAAGREPEDATPGDLKAFRALLLRGVGARVGGYSSATANSRYGTVLRFYRWSQETGALDSPLGMSLRSVPGAIKRGQQSALRQTPTLARFVYTRIPRIVTADEIRRITSLAPQPYSLMFRWAVCTGMRRFELCNLRVETVHYLEREIERHRNDLAKADILRKGSRLRSIYVPTRLIEDTRRYLLFERYPAARDCEEFLFISRSGDHVSKSRLSAVFKEAARRAGVSATLHHLRHTYAVVVLSRLQENMANGSSINPLKTLQILMGHADISTTEIYLRAIEINSPAVKEALSYLFGDVR